VAEPLDAELIDVLVSRDGIATAVTLKSGLRLTVHNIAWGYDIGDEHAHVTTNISPEVGGATIDFFLTSEIQSISDLASGAPLA
jgi:hypothetical protein